MEDDLLCLKKENKALREKVIFLESIIESYHITTFEENVQQLKLAIRKGINQLATELQLMEHDPNNLERIEDLIAYMQYYINELQQFTFVESEFDENKTDA